MLLSIISFLHDGTPVNTPALLPRPALLSAQHRIPLQFACSRVGLLYYAMFHNKYAGGGGAEERMQVQAAAAVRQRRPAGGGHLRPPDRLRHQAGRQSVTGSEH